MPIRFRCPKCTQAYSISSKKAGSKINCQKCGAKMRIPSLDINSDADGAEGVGAVGEAAESPALTPELKDAFENLFDDDEFDEVEPDVEFAQAESSSLSAAANRDEAPADDDVDAVLEFEKQLEDAGHESAAPAPVYVPDELFAGDDDEDEEDDFFSSGSRVDDEEMDLTPMVDVTFLLLIFFMITASFSIQKTLEVPAPDPDEEGASTSISIQEMEETSVTVHIDSRNVMYVDDEPVSDPTRLPDMLRASRMNEVLITSHENALHEMVVKAIDAANEVQMQKIRLGVTRGAE
jgi:biopolymer transport protein ExbD